MPKDFAANPKSAPVQRSRIPKWVWLLTLVITAGFIGMLYILQTTEIPEDPEIEENLSLLDAAKDKVKGVTDQISEDVEKTVEKKKEEYTFYKLLPKQEVDTDHVKQVQDRNSPEIQAKTHWLLQAASFSKEQDANSMRADLILRGLTSTYIDKVDVTGKGTFYRVMVGPLENRSKMNRARDVLAEARIDPIQKKITVE